MYWNIEQSSDGKGIPEVEPQHKMYWNLLYHFLLNIQLQLNRNIRCIEINTNIFEKGIFFSWTAT